MLERPKPDETKATLQEVLSARERLNTASLAAALSKRSIKMLGTVREPLFCAADVDAYVSVGHYLRTIRNYILDGHIRQLEVTDANGQWHQMYFFTEAGLYKYLLQSQEDVAGELQYYVFSLLKTERAQYLEAALEIAKKNEAALERIHQDLLAEYANLRALDSQPVVREPIPKCVEQPLGPGCLYFIGKADDDTSPTKIGYSKNLLRRLQNLQEANAAKLVIRRAILVTHAVEAEARAHKYFKDRHRRGEWYDLTPEAIRTYTDDWE